MTTRSSCSVCGSTEPYVEGAVLWPELIEHWELTLAETAYINRQQGTYCPDCHSNLRSQVLARALLNTQNMSGPLATASIQASILEINECGHLHKHLAKLSNHTYVEYPTVDMQNMYDISSGSLNVVVHSDTLEHVIDPQAALRECHRVLTSPGYCIFTVPTLVDKLTRSTANRPATYHGSSALVDPSMRVYTEYGMDIWKCIIAAGFNECRIVTLEYPAAIAYIGIKS